MQAGRDPGMVDDPMQDRARLLIVDDERVSLKNLEYLMKNEGYDVVCTQSGQNAVRHLTEQKFDVVLTDMRMDRVDGMQVLKKCREVQPDAEIILITAYATLESAVDTMRQGAYSYIAKPAKFDELRRAVKDAIQKVMQKRKTRSLSELLARFHGKVKIIARDPSMLRPLDAARQISQVDSNVFITGERGTGKKLFARYIHENSGRSEGQFFSVSCGSLSEDQLSVELFGQEKAGYAEPAHRKKGVLAAASGGTLFLEDITSMPASLQGRLLQVLEDKELMRLGTAKPTTVDVRLIAASDRNPVEVAREATFRQDLYYRLNVVALHLPPLAGRREDIPLLAYYFLNKYSAALQKHVTEISGDAMTLLLDHPYPGNVRELENIIEHSVALTSGSSLESAHLPGGMKEMGCRSFKSRDGRIPSLEDQERAYITWVLNEVAGNRTLAAQILGIDRVSLWRKMKKYGLEIP